ncbi:hypothetical protein [Streptomyces sp. NPDC058401]
MDWQRRHAYLHQVLTDVARLTAIVPGVTRHGDDIGGRLGAPAR